MRSWMIEPAAKLVVATAAALAAASLGAVGQLPVEMVAYLGELPFWLVFAFAASLARTSLELLQGEGALSVRRLMASLSVSLFVCLLAVGGTVTVPFVRRVLIVGGSCFLGEGLLAAALSQSERIRRDPSQLLSLRSVRDVLRAVLVGGKGRNGD